MIVRLEPEGTAWRNKRTARFSLGKAHDSSSCHKGSNPLIGF